jgi:hypothetical protein
MFFHIKFLDRTNIKCQIGPVLPLAQVFYFNGFMYVIEFISSARCHVSIRLVRVAEMDVEVNRCRGSNADIHGWFGCAPARDSCPSPARAIRPAVITFLVHKSIFKYALVVL